MSAILLETSAHATAIHDWLQKEMSIVNQEGLQVTITKEGNDQHYRISCACKTHDKSAEEVFIYYVASALTGVILTSFELAEAERYLKREFRAIPPVERDMLINHILHILRHAYQKPDGVPRTRVILELMNYLDLHRAINLEGFIRFRLKGYLRQIAAAADEAIAAYQAHLAQQELVELLQCFMEAQESKIDLLEVVLDHNGNFNLLDENHNAIDKNYLEGFVDDLLPGAVDSDDLLISALVTLAPGHVRCHCRETAPVLKTLQAVFTDRFSLCLGCSICAKSFTQRTKRLPVRPTGC